MSRKARADKSTWQTASIYAFQGGYGPFKPPRDGSTIDNVLCLLVHHDDILKRTSQACHSDELCALLAGEAQELLLRNRSFSDRYRAILVLDVRRLWGINQTKNSAVSENKSNDNKKKTPLTINPHEAVQKAVLRMLERLILRNVTIVAWDVGCQLLLQLALGPLATQPKYRGTVSSLWLVHPYLPAKFVNQHLTTAWKAALPVHISFPDKIAQAKRLNIIRHVFPNGREMVQAASSLVQLFRDQNEATVPRESQDLYVYDKDYISEAGHSLFLSRVTCEMNPHTKQYDRLSEEMTSDLLTTAIQKPAEYSENASNIDLTSLDWTKAERQIGALVLRGNRCVLVRSLEGQWKGMRIPRVIPKAGEIPEDAAIRSVVENCGVDANEVRSLPGIAPVFYYLVNGNTSDAILSEVYPLYAIHPPPDGPLEDQDMEDDETPYDWYTLENASKRLDSHAVAALKTMALTLQQANMVGLLPSKWGGIFGQEFLQSGTVGMKRTAEKKSSTEECILQHPPPLTTSANPLGASVVVSPINDTAALSCNNKKLPVTVLSGFLGSGKTTLMSHILTNSHGLRVAILVNDMGDVNIDAALLQQTAVKVHQREEHLVELSNGCICCTLREDLLIEIRNIARQGVFDYLLVESSGISEPMPVAETFTFEDEHGHRLSDISTIDAMVTVVDGSRFLSELDTLESLKSRDWHADSEDERTISHLLCDQVEFANIVILNKCDLIDVAEREKIKHLIHEMNPTAHLLESTYSSVPLEQIVGTNLFSMSEAEKFNGWLQEARVGEHTPETEEYSISSFTYRALKPFHPDRLDKALKQFNKDPSSPFHNILRAKGFLWIVHSPELQGDFSFAGQQYAVFPGNPWWAAIDKSEWPDGLEKDIEPLWHEPHGDRQQEIVIIGQKMKKDQIIAVLDGCLCSPEEMDSKEWVTQACSKDPFFDIWKAAAEMRAIKAGEPTST